MSGDPQSCACQYHARFTLFISRVFLPLLLLWRGMKWQACRNVFCTAELDAEGRLQRRDDGRIRGFRACIADFGRCVPLPPEGELRPVTEPKQPLRDQPPEVLAQMVHGARSDVFSFALLMWALGNGTRPWPWFTLPQDAARRRCDGQRLPPPAGAGALHDAGLWLITRHCWAHNEAARPSMVEVCAALEVRVAALGAERATGGGAPAAAGTSYLVGGADADAQAAGAAVEARSEHKRAEEHLGHADIEVGSEPYNILGDAPYSDADDAEQYSDAENAPSDDAAGDDSLSHMLEVGDKRHGPRAAFGLSQAPTHSPLLELRRLEGSAADSK